jgi:hypothetical protein
VCSCSAGGLDLDDPNFWEKVLGEDVSAEALLVRAQGESMQLDEQRGHLFEEVEALTQGLLEKLTTQYSSFDGPTVEESEMDCARRLLLFLSANKEGSSSRMQEAKANELLAALDDAQNKRGRKRTCRAMDDVDDGGDVARTKIEEDGKDGKEDDGKKKGKKKKDEKDGKEDGKGDGSASGKSSGKSSEKSGAYPRFEVEDIYTRTETPLNDEEGVIGKMEVVFERGDYVRCKAPPPQLNDRSRAAAAGAAAAAAAANVGDYEEGDGGGGMARTESNVGEVLGIISQIYTWYEDARSDGELMVDIVMLHRPQQIEADGKKSKGSTKSRPPLQLPDDPFSPSAAALGSRGSRKRPRKGNGKKAVCATDDEWYYGQFHPNELLMCFDEVRLKASDVRFKFSCVFAEPAFAPALLKVRRSLYPPMISLSMRGSVSSVCTRSVCTAARAARVQRD